MVLADCTSATTSFAVIVADLLPSSSAVRTTCRWRCLTKCSLRFKNSKQPYQTRAQQADRHGRRPGAAPAVAHPHRQCDPVQVQQGADPRDFRTSSFCKSVLKVALM